MALLCVLLALYMYVADLGNADLMRWYRFGTDFFACDCEKLKMYWMYIEFFGKKQAGKDVPKMCRRINQRFLKGKGRNI